MPKKKSVFTITEDLNNLFIERPAQSKSISKRLTIDNALTTITRQMEISGNRPRTISDYSIHVNHFKDTTGLAYLSDITAERIYYWLSLMDVSNQTKLIRLKCLKAFLSRCFQNGWIERQFWKPIKIRVDSNVKEGATKREVRTLLSLLDLR
jgi:hypothetical protein